MRSNSMPFRIAALLVLAASVVVSFCAHAIGAGGGGTYRSRTGDPQGWQIAASKGWVALPK
jgi:hypothetical protein